MGWRVLEKRYRRNQNFHRAPTSEAPISPCADRFFCGNPNKPPSPILHDFLNKRITNPTISEHSSNAVDADSQSQQSTVADEPRREVHPIWNTGNSPTGAV